MKRHLQVLLRQQSLTTMPSSMETTNDDRKHVEIEHAESIPSYDEDRVLEEKALVRKIDLFLLPTIFLMYKRPIVASLG